MSSKAIQLTFFAVLTAIVAVLLFFILKPYLGVIFISGIFAVVFYPVYQKLVRKFGDKKGLAALVTTLLILVFIIIPIIILSTLLLREAVGLYNTLILNGGSTSIISQANILINKLNSFVFPGVIDSSVNIELYARNLLNWIIGNFDSIFRAIFGGALKFILMLISLYYFFIFGNKIKEALIRWSPLPDKYDRDFIKTMRYSIDNVLRGRILASIVQGVFIGIGFAIFGIGSPILWGFVGGIASLVPILGTSIITVPAVAYLFLSHNFGAGIGLLIWGVLAVGMIDNFISVIFLKGKIKVHPLIVLFSILGGVEVFGVIGFLVGPVIASAFIALMNIYPLIMSSYRSQQT